MIYFIGKLRDIIFRPLILLLLLSGQCPNPRPLCPCGVCDSNVTCHGTSYLCTACQKWVHARCSGLARRSLYRRDALAPEVSQIFKQLFFSFSNLPVVVMGPVSVEELASVEDAHSARFARYGNYIDILACLWF